MPDRKQFFVQSTVDPELTALLKKASPATEEQLHEQRISFAFGNSLESDAITKDSVRKASSSLLLIS